MSEEQNIPENKQTIISPSDNENNSAKESVLTPQETTPIVQTEQSIMEVHKHPHQVPHKKKWGEYLLEFLMIFLAVFLGFIAENIREHYVEHQRAKEYAQSLYNDLKKDSLILKRTISLKQWRSEKLDSLIILMKQTDLQKYARELYYFSGFLGINLPFRPSDISIQQLSGSGTLRYFTNIQLYNIITEYYNNCNFYIERENESNQMLPPITLTSKIFSADPLTSMLEDPPPFDIKEAVHWPDKNQEFKLLTVDRQTWNEYSLYVQMQKRRNGLSLLLLHQLVEKPQIELMTTLKKEYHLN